MAIMFDFDASEPTQVLMDDCFTKLCRVPFPVLTARAPSVMHYEDECTRPTLMFQCNSYIHMRRVHPASPLRINGVSTKKYATVPCDGYEDLEIQETLAAYKEAGYYAYTANVNDAVRMYITWDERCLNTPDFSEESEESSEV